MLRLLPLGNQISATKRMLSFGVNRHWTPRYVAQSFLTRLLNFKEQWTFLDVAHEAIFVQYFCWKKHLKCDTITVMPFTVLHDYWPKCLHSRLIKFYGLAFGKWRLSPLATHPNLGKAITWYAIVTFFFHVYFELDDCESHRQSVQRMYWLS